MTIITSPEMRRLSYSERFKTINFPITEKKRIKGNLITTLKFLNQNDNVSSKKF